MKVIPMILKSTANVNTENQKSNQKQKCENRNITQETFPNYWAHVILHILILMVICSLCFCNLTQNWKYIIIEIREASKLISLYYMGIIPNGRWWVRAKYCHSPTTTST